MGAVGEAKVTAFDPCPQIQPGPGAVITGKFRHEADENSKVLSLRLEEQDELIGVTDNHPFWSHDRQEFISAGKIQVGEQVDTKFGPKKVLSIIPREYNGHLYNLETTEHVYRVSSLGTFAHNSCVRKVDPGKLRIPEEKTHDVAATSDKLRKQIAKFGERTDWDTKLYGIQDKYGNIKILNGTTRAARVYNFNLERKFSDRILVEIEFRVDNLADFRRPALPAP